ncbi:MULTISPECIES: OmpA family protein [Marinobacter]|jgi:outer membrane protein OmpA-like peptidoglycan-associated protein|uniref:OmpA family protein n=1 Tax=Marinobacter TaxID=2742 RepID=UPI00294308CF|nr:OmpA family protein [Marinobacter salarius]WOI18875.1 OmpA family protein [Marinobacter salarius]
MNKRNMTLGMAVSFSVLVAGCASTPQDNAKVDEARAAYEEISNDPNVARSGDRQLRSAREQLSRAETLLADGADIAEIEHAAYLANRHAQVAAEQGERAELQEQIDSAEARRKELELQMRADEAAQARREAKELRLQMEAMQAEQTDRGMVLTLGDVLFDLDKAELKSSGEATVRRLAEFMAEYENRRVRVEGYTDSTGEASYNQGLSERRAEAVRDTLVDMGISRSRVETKGFGEQFPVASNDTSGGRQQNRRVEIVISDEEGNIKAREN